MEDKGREGKNENRGKEREEEKRYDERGEDIQEREAQGTKGGGEGRKEKTRENSVSFNVTI